uniref:Uncharacterized protein n=1 Tax=Glossina morsitans morsitans TaxID=37546 RepID=A0A1B0FP55_GLOMM
MCKISYFLLIGVLALNCICESYCGSLPSDIPKCKISDNVCIASSMNEVLRLYPKGSPAFDLADLSRIFVPKVELENAAGHSSAVQLNLVFLNSTTSGLEKAKVVNVSGFDPDIKQIIVNLEVPFLKLEAEYEMDGKILFLTLKGKGHAEIHLKMATNKVTINVGLEKRKGKTHLIVKDMTCDFRPQGFFIHLDNLFDGNKEITDSVNEVINTNWRDVYSALSDNINRSLAQGMLGILRDVAESLSYDDIYLK